jgi:hypothetical protein
MSFQIFLVLLSLDDFYQLFIRSICACKHGFYPRKVSSVYYAFLIAPGVQVSYDSRTRLSALDEIRLCTAFYLCPKFPPSRSPARFLPQQNHEPSF